MPGKLSSSGDAGNSIIKEIILQTIRDWSKSMGGRGGGPEHLEMWWVKNT